MTDVLKFFISMFSSITDLLSSVTFEMYGFTVDLFSIFLVFIIIGMVASVWWRGAKG